jgi:hypothetical protein
MFNLSFRTNRWFTLILALLFCLSFAAVTLLYQEIQPKFFNQLSTADSGGVALSGNNAINQIVEEKPINVDSTTSPAIGSESFSTAQTQPSDEETKAKVLNNYGQLPLHFEPNNGQIKSDQVKFSARGQGYQMFLTPTGATLALRQSAAKTSDIGTIPTKDVMRQIKREEKLSRQTEKQAVVEMQILGANKEAQSSGGEELESKSNYFIGNDQSQWKTDVANYKRVRFDQVYSGISLEYYGNQRQLEYDFIVAPNADPSQIKLKYKGVKTVKVNETGELVLKTTLGEIIQKKPFVYQTDETGERREIASSYKVSGREVNFELAEYDRTKQLTIDPVVLVYSTFHGGSGYEIPAAIAVDNLGSAYVSGYTLSNNFPNALNGPRPASRQDYDTFVSKFNAAGNELVYSTYLGGSEDEYLSGTFASIAVDSGGNAYVTGNTKSRHDSLFPFPTTEGARQRVYGGGTLDGFVTKLNPTGNILLYSTYLGGNGYDWLGEISVDAQGFAYVTGFGNSTNMPFTPNVIQPNFKTPAPGFPCTRGDYGACDDTYIAKINQTGSGLVYFT